MTEPADLEILIRRRDNDNYLIDLRFLQPDNESETRPLGNQPGIASFDLSRLLTLSGDNEAYGKGLGAMLFGDQRVAQAVTRVRDIAAGNDLLLRLRLMLAPDADALHALRWETLRWPGDGVLLTTGERICFARYLAGTDWQPVRRRARADLRAVALIANPTDLARYNLAPINVVEEQELIRKALKGMSLTMLAGEARASLSNLRDAFRQGCDILYLVCHGTLKDGESVLWLEDDAGAAVRVSGFNLTTMVAELAQRPRLAVLVACESAITGTAEILAGLGPRIAEAGVPAVIAMQGKISMTTAESFLEAFFSELQRDGHIDRAVAAARGSVRERTDFWSPVLFSRLRSGFLWYKPGLAEADFKRWPALLQSIRKGQCTPILGSGLLEPLIGSTRQIARSWADTYGFPLAAYVSEDLPQVAQYLAVNQGEQFVRGEIGDAIRRELMRRIGPELPEELRKPTVALDVLISAAGALLASRNPAEPHRVLASLPFPVYITTNPDYILEQAFSATQPQKEPTVIICPWNEDIAAEQTTYTGEPTVERPLLLHLFGHFSDPSSLVLTEGDYFDYLKGMSSNKGLIPEVVRYRLTGTSLLFLGFRLDDWSFRVLFRSIMSPEVRNRRKLNQHVAVQIDLDEGQVLQPARAQRYLEGYFGGSNVSIYWGSTEEFIRELESRLAAG